MSSVNGITEKATLVNFAGGPAKLPREVLKEAQAELLDFQGTGISILETSHRSPDFAKVLKDTEQGFRDVLEIPDNYRILFQHGGGTGQFSAVPLNLLPADKTAHYFVTGNWSSNAYKEAIRLGKITLAFPQRDKYQDLPQQWEKNEEAAYAYYCDNETVHGVEWTNPPDVGSIPLVCDMSSNLLTKRVDVSKYGCIFAGAQKTLGPAGVTFVTVREDLLGHARSDCPAVLEWSKNVKAGSLLNTPPTFAIYMVGKVVSWVAKRGGVPKMEQICQQKSQLIYDIVDRSNGIYKSTVDPACRSRVNIVFKTVDSDMDAKFVKEAAAEGLVSLKGHRSVGGIRASLYNAISLEETQKLADFMERFRDNQLDKS